MKPTTHERLQPVEGPRSKPPRPVSSPILRRRKTLLLAFSAIVLGLIIYWYLFRPAAIQVAKVAAVIPLSGEDSLSGEELKTGIDLARMAIQKGELLPHDYRMVIEVYDDKSTPDGAKAAAYDVVSDPSNVAVIGHFSSANTLAALPIYRNAGLPLVMPVATLTSITEGAYPNAFRLPPNNALQSQTIAAFTVNELRRRQIFLIHDDTEYARDLAFSVETSLRNLRTEPIGIETIPRGSQNFPVLTGLANFDPPIDAIIFVGYSPEAVYLARQLRLSGQLEAALICTDGVYGTRFRISDGAEGAYVVYQVPPPQQLEARPQWSFYSGEFQRRAKFERPDPPMNPEGWAAWSYDAVGVVHQALRASLRLTRVPRARNIIHVLTGSADSTPFEYRGALGDYEFDRHGDNKHGYYYVYQVRDSNFEWRWSYGNRAGEDQ